MKFKVAGLASTALLLLSPITGAFTAAINTSTVHAENNWDYDVDNPGINSYDALLQNAGPSDGIVDWYPAKDALGDNPTGQELVKELIDLSIATNDSSSNARKVLFNDTVGNLNDIRSEYKTTYDKYPVALGFIAQILNFNNSKSGLGAKLEQDAVDGDQDPTDSDGNSVIAGKIKENPADHAAQIGKNVSDVLGSAFFGDPDDAYAQIYLNGYDNVSQNEANIIRESTSSITIVAQSKSTGKKATAIFKLNNKTLPKGADGMKLNNYVDNSVYALDNKNGNGEIAGLNMTTASQSTIDNLNFSKQSTFWASGTKNANAKDDGAGTIVVPRGTTAKQVAKLIADRKLDGNNSLRESAPMKAVQAAKMPADAGADNEIAGAPTGSNTWKDVSYDHFYESTGVAKANGSGSDSLYNFADSINTGINGPDNPAFSVFSTINENREYNGPFNSRNGWFGQSYNTTKMNTRMIDTNELFDPSKTGKFTNKSAASLPGVKQSEATPFDSDDVSLGHAKNMTDLKSKVAGVLDDNSEKATNVGKVTHLFQPSDYFKEAYDANHFVTNSPSLKDNNVDDIASKIANNGSFSGTDVNAQIKKSFTYETPVSAWLYKSYNNPYSTVVSSAGAKTVDGKTLDETVSTANSTVQPQEYLDLSNPNNQEAKDDPKNIKLSENISPIFVGNYNPSTYEFDATPSGTNPVFFWAGTFKKGLPSDSTNILTIDFNTMINGTSGSVGLPSVNTGNKIMIPAGTSGTLVKYGAVGSDTESYGSGSTTGKEIGQSTIDNSGIGIGTGKINGPGGLVINGSNQKWVMNGKNIGLENGLNGETLNFNNPYDKMEVWDNSQYFVQTWDKNKTTKEAQGDTFVPTDKPEPLIYNINITKDPNQAGGINSDSFEKKTLSAVDSPNFEAKYYYSGYFELAPDGSGDYTIKRFLIGNHLAQTAASTRAYFNSNLYNNPNGYFANDLSTGEAKTYTNNSRFFVSQDFSVGPVSTDMVSDPGGTDLTINGVTYPASKGTNPEVNAEKIIEFTAKNNDPTQNPANQLADPKVKNEFTADNGYKLVSLDEAAEKQGTTVDALANEVAKVTGKSVQTVKNTKWLEASLPRVKTNAGQARINVVVYDKEAVPAPTKQDTKPSFSTTDLSSGNDPFNVSLRPYTTTYDDGAVLKTSDVPDSFKNLLSTTLTAGNPDLVDATGKVSTNKLQQILVSSFLGSWQQNDGSFNQTDSGSGVSSPLYLYGGFGISNSDTKNSYAQWPMGYIDNSGDYNNAINSFSGDFYRGSADLKTADGKTTIKGIPFSALTADVSKLDITKPGTYPVVYTYTNPDNAKDTASITVPVTVSDASAPVFAFQNSKDSTIKVGESFNQNDYKVVGSWAIFNNYSGDYSKLPNFEGIAKNSDGTPQVTVSGNVDTNTPGIYQLTYKAVSTSGAVTTMVRNVTVLPKESTTDWTMNDMKAVGYINYTPGYGIMVYTAPATGAKGQRLAHGTSWKISQKAVNANGDTFYKVGTNQWINGKYVTFSPINTITPLKGEVKIVYKKGYGVNLWKSAGTTGGFYTGRKLKHGTSWKTSGKQNGFYKVGKDQWIQGDYASYKSY